MWMIYPPLSRISASFMGCLDSQSVVTVSNFLVVVKHSVASHVGSDLELSVLKIRSSSVELLVGNTNCRPSLVNHSVATPHMDWVLIGVLFPARVDTHSLVLVRFEVSETFCNVSEPLSVITSTSPWLHNKLSSVFDWTVLDTEDKSSVCLPSDDAIFCVEEEHFSFIVQWEIYDSSILIIADVFVDGDDSIAFHLGLDLESLAVFEASVLGNSWEVLDLPLLVGTVVTRPVGSRLVLFVFISPNINTYSLVSSVVES